jgi:hypothetical protein
MWMFLKTESNILQGFLLNIFMKSNLWGLLHTICCSISRAFPAWIWWITHETSRLGVQTPIPILRTTLQLPSSVEVIGHFFQYTISPARKNVKNYLICCNMPFKNMMKIFCHGVSLGLDFKRLLICCVIALIIHKTADINFPPLPDWSEVDFTNFETIQQSLGKQINLSFSLYSLFPPPTSSLFKISSILMYNLCI